MLKDSPLSASIILQFQFWKLHLHFDKDAN
jgi:hypothetical protein